MTVKWAFTRREIKRHRCVINLSDENYYEFTKEKRKKKKKKKRKGEEGERKKTIRKKQAA